VLGRKGRHAVRSEAGSNPSAHLGPTVADADIGGEKSVASAAVKPPEASPSHLDVRVDLRDISVIVNTHMVAGSLKGWLAKRAGGPADAIPLLQNVTLSLRPGDRLGIVGRNGQGKTVLSKVIAGIYPPTSGKREVYGRIAAVLATGMGLDGELTVRDNVKLGLAYLGELRLWSPAKEAVILNFAELEQHVGRLYKHLSSGQKSRLAFSIVVQRRPDILLLDEVFAAGDEGFVQKATNAMRTNFENTPISVLVSHSRTQVNQLCNRAVLVDRGRIVIDGTVKEALSEYDKVLARAS
jgi:lipopolysaccharide transport system ATP-binding protein